MNSILLHIAVMNEHTKDEILLKKISLRIKEIREEKGISQENFYNNTNIHIARIERANVNISVTTLSRICEYFEISIADFFEGIDN